VIHELNHFGIVVRDLQKSLAFYQDVLGARIVFRGFIESTGTDIVYLQIHGGLVELLARGKPLPGESFGVTHMAFLSDDLDADFASLVDAGYEPLVQPKVAGSGNGRVAFIADANGARIELIDRELDVRTEPVEHEYIRSFDHYSLIANDLEGAEDFYVDRLGMKLLTERYVEKTGLTLKYLHYGYDVLEIWHKEAPSSAPVFAHIALRVDDVDATLEAFAAQGVETHPETTMLSGTGVGRIGIIHDPDGVKIELLDRPDLRESTR
jgi:catechol 2,3-dioxygenase-like lactoylglutathione lyase family enzyme